MRGNKSINLKKGLLSLTFFFLLFNIFYIQSLSASPAVFYNFSNVNVGGTNNSDVLNEAGNQNGIMYYVSSPYRVTDLNYADVSQNVQLNEVTPIGLQNAFQLVVGPPITTGGHTLINTNQKGYQISQDFSFSTWFRRDTTPINTYYNTAGTQVTQNYYLLGLSNTSNNPQPYLNFQVKDQFNSYQFTTKVTHQLIFTYGIKGGAQTNCITQMPSDSNWHQVGFIYNYKGITDNLPFGLGGNTPLVTLYIDGVANTTCLNTGLSGVFNMNNVGNFVLGTDFTSVVDGLGIDQSSSGTTHSPTTNTYDKNATFFPEMNNVNLYAYMINDTGMSSLYSNSISIGASPTVTQPFAQTYNVTNQTFTFNINDYFNNWYKVNLSYPEFFPNGTRFDLNYQKNLSDNTITSFNYSIFTSLQGTGNDTIFNLGTGPMQTSEQMRVTVYNDYGSASQIFAVYNSHGFQRPGLVIIHNYTSNGTLGSITDSFNGFFPPYNTISDVMKYAYVLIFIFVIMAISVLVLKSETGITIGGFLSLLAFAYFVMIGYVSATIVTLIIVIGLVVLYFKFKGGSKE